jgi:hypothetical protein
MGVEVGVGMLIQRTCTLGRSRIVERLVKLVREASEVHVLLLLGEEFLLRDVVRLEVSSCIRHLLLSLCPTASASFLNVDNCHIPALLVDIELALRAGCPGNYLVGGIFLLNDFFNGFERWTQ